MLVCQIKRRSDPYQRTLSAAISNIYSDHVHVLYESILVSVVTE
jgi:hypothetical protein